MFKVFGVHRRLLLSSSLLHHTLIVFALQTNVSSIATNLSMITLGYGIEQTLQLQLQLQIQHQQQQMLKK